MATDVKQFLYAWLGKRKVTPNYEFRTSGNKHRQRFACDVSSHKHLGAGLCLFFLMLEYLAKGHMHAHSMAKSTKLVSDWYRRNILCVLVWALKFLDHSFRNLIYFQGTSHSKLSSMKSQEKQI